MVVADFNKDGRVDVATAGGYNDKVYISLGAGDGTLLAATTFTVENPSGLAYGDLDRDGNLDLVAVSDSYDAKVWVLAGQGDGTFASAVSYDAGAAVYLYRVATADVNQDGNLDVITIDNYYSGTEDMYVLLGNGDGTLQPSSSTELGQQVGNWILSDVNADSIDDFLYLAGANLHVMRGNGNGTFQTAVTSPLPGSASAITTGDFDGDGTRDIAAVDYNEVFVLLGNGDGTFAAGASFSTGYSSSSITTGDINADGKLDVITGGGYVSTLLGNGDGTLQPAISYYGDGYWVDVADFNADGRADLVYTHYSGVRIRLGGCPDLQITKTHSGNFYGGSTGTYSITVSNVGAGSTTGPVTITDTLPAGLTATSYYSYDSSCTLATNTLTCTRAGALLPGDYQWTISLDVTVSASAPTSVTNVATLSGGGDTNPANNSASDPTTIIHVPDLVITKTHAGTVWTPGQNGTYTITVGNIGTGKTSGLVSVTDQLPYGMSPVSMSGPGWTCSVLTCTRSDALAPTALYPPITLVVSIGAGASSTNNRASVAGAGERNIYNNSVNDYTRILTAPSSVVATATTSSQVAVTWWPTYGEQPVYEVFRSTGNGPYVQVGSTLGTTFYDNAVAANTVYLYQVRKKEGSVVGPFSARDWASTLVYTDDPIVARSTRIKRIHIEQLRAAVNQVRASVGLPAAVFTDPSLAGLVVKKIHIAQLRIAVNDARVQAGLGGIAFNDSTSIMAAHINDLRSALK
jgi:uncharacterized repeat protein (TIGR01451 family)